MKYSEYTIDDALRLKGTFLLKDNGEGMTPEQLKEDNKLQLAALDVAAGLTVALEFDTRSLPLLQYIGDTTRKNRVVTDRFTLTTMLKQAKADTIPVSTFDSEEAIVKYVAADAETFAGYAASSMNSEIDDVAGNVETYRYRYEERMEEAQENSEKMVLAESKLEALQQVRDNMLSNSSGNLMLDSIRLATDSTGWDFVGAMDSRLFFALNVPVTLRHVNPVAGVDISIYFGYMCAVLNLDDLSIGMGPYKEGKRVGNNHHPHLSGTRICWGNASIPVKKCLKALDIKGTLEYCRALLTQYGEANPYRGISSWRSGYINGNIFPRNDMEQELFAAYLRGISLSEYTAIKEEEEAARLAQEEIDRVAAEAEARIRHEATALVVDAIMEIPKVGGLRVATLISRDNALIATIVVGDDKKVEAVRVVDRLGCRGRSCPFTDGDSLLDVETLEWLVDYDLTTSPEDTYHPSHEAIHIGEVFTCNDLDGSFVLMKKYNSYHNQCDWLVYSSDDRDVEFRSASYHVFTSVTSGEVIPSSVELIRTFVQRELPTVEGVSNEQE